MIVQKAAASCFAPRLTHHMADLMTEERLPAETGKVQHSRSKGDIRTAGNGAGAGVGHGLAFIKLYGGKVRAERVLHLGAHGVRKIDPMSHLLPRGFYGAGTQRIQRRLRGRLRMLCGIFRPFTVAIGNVHLDLTPFGRYAAYADKGLRSVERLKTDCFCIRLNDPNG